MIRYLVAEFIHLLNVSRKPVQLKKKNLQSLQPRKTEDLEIFACLQARPFLLGLVIFPTAADKLSR